MKSGYEVVWSKRADQNLQKTYEYLNEFWTEKEIRSLSKEIERTIQLIRINPELFQETGVPSVKRAVVKKLNSIFFHVDERTKRVTVLSFFDNRQDPKKKRL
ncbi:MAG: type II toxin-antitoxin system RelE/ParE family toxin [Flavobacteriales bacterium]|nr:type II toxin-antitoxin system RelE/ParE family toxin [Flavobacteriales bacterium]